MFGDPSHQPLEQVRRLLLFLSAYGPEPTDAEVVANILDRQSILIAESGQVTEWAADGKARELETT
jgi:hypothetical protein